MSVDYEAVFGLGYKVDISGDIDPFGKASVIGNIINVEMFECVTVADYWSGEVFGVYLILKEPFKYGHDLNKIKEELDTQIDSTNITVKGSFGVVGGMSIY